MTSPPEATPTEVLARSDKHTLTEDDKSADADATPSTIDSGPRCYILELPRELRDMIYDRVLEDTPAVPSRNTRKKVATRAALLRVSLNQINLSNNSNANQIRATSRSTSSSLSVCCMDPA